MEKSRLKISIVVATYNGQRTIQECISSLIMLDYPFYEILIIDNNSTDKTKSIVQTFQKKHKRIHYFNENKQGLSFSRNRGIKESTGEIVAFIDDDAIADKLWLHYLALAYSVKSKIGCVGGKVLPLKTINFPTWFKKEMLSILGVFDYGNETKVLPTNISPIGCNISYRKEVIMKVGKFNVDLGRKKESLLSCEETEMCKRLGEAGYIIMYEPKAKVYHNLNEEKFSIKYLLKRYFMDGVSSARIDIVEEKSLVKNAAIVLVHLLYFISKRDFNYLFKATYRTGVIKESLFT